MRLTAEKTVIDIDNFYGKACDLCFVVNGKDEITIQLPIDWKQSELSEIIKEALFTCGDYFSIKTIRITSIKENKTLLN